MTNKKPLILAAALAFFGGLLAGWLIPRSDSAETVGINADGTHDAIARAWGGDLNMRTYPGRAGFFQGTASYGDVMKVECKVDGEQVTWNDLSTDIWFRLDNGNYVTEAYSDLIGVGPIRECETLPQEPSDGPRETSYAEIRTAGQDYELVTDANSSEVERSIPNRTALTLVCFQYGVEEAGFFSPSDLWYEVEGGGWANEGSLITGTGGVPPVAACG